MITRLLVKLSQSIWFTSHFPISSVPSPMVVPCFSACQVRSQDLLRDRLGEKIFASRFSSLAYRPGEDWDKDSDLILIYSRYIYICMFIIVDIYIYIYVYVYVVWVWWCWKPLLQAQVRFMDNLRTVCSQGTTSAKWRFFAMIIWSMA